MIKFFSEVGKDDIAIVGGKGANLGELTKSDFNVPNGFVITTKAYNTFVEIRKLADDIAERLSKLDVGNHDELEKISKELKKLIIDEEIFDELVVEVEKGISKLKGDKFAVRSSATAEDLITASFAGQQDSFIDVSKKDIIDSVKKCWASLFNVRAIYYRHEKKISHDVAMAVVIQEMVPADFAGVMFTVDPVRKKHILVEAATGLGEKVVSGTVTPSSFMIDRESFEIVEKNINYEVDEGVIKDVAKIGISIENHYSMPQDIEFAVKEKEIFILQSRAITTL